MKVSIQGIKGAFHEEAAKNYFKSDIDIIPNKFEGSCWDEYIFETLLENK